MNRINDMHMAGMDWADCYIGLRGARNPAEFEGIPADVVASHKHAMGVISSERNRTRWVLSRVPNESFAQQAGMTLDDINRYCYDILYDEKIGGTIHLAMGRAYPKCGGTNDSSLHWDIIKDLREEGEVYVDGRLVMKNGVHLIK